MEPRSGSLRQRSMRTTAALPFVSLVLSIAACGGGTDGDPGREGTTPAVDPDSVEVTVSWVPPSTPDEHDTGSSLSLSADGIERTEGDAAPTTEPMDRDRWEEFVDDLPAALDDIDDEDSSCVGAGGTILTIEGAGRLDQQISAMVCGGEAAPAAEQIDALVADFR